MRMFQLRIAVFALMLITAATLAIAQSAPPLAQALPDTSGQVATPRPLPIPSANVNEPKSLNVPCFLDSSGALVTLERATAKVKTSAKLTGGAKQVAQVKEDHSPTRLFAAPNLSFVIHLASGVDPSKWQLYAFESKKGKREVTLMNAGYFSVKQGPGPVAFDVEKYGESSYKLTPTKALALGEYGFSATDAQDVFCFGVDSAK